MFQPEVACRDVSIGPAASKLALLSRDGAQAQDAEGY